MSRSRHVPMRTCLGCATIDEQHALLRVVRDADGGLAVDRDRRMTGRGGYLHARPQCWDRFAARKGMVRSLRVAVDRPARAALVAQLRGDAGSEG